MNRKLIYRLKEISVLDVCGTDATTIVHNVTTNEVKSLEVGEGRETFVTDVRGKMLGHVWLFRTAGGFRMIGAAGQSPQIAEHADRYTIREDAVPTIRDQEFTAFILPSTSAQEFAVIDQPDAPQLRCGSNDILGDYYQAPWLDLGTVVVLVLQQEADQIQDRWSDQGFEFLGDDDFHQQRTKFGFPWYGIDLDESNLPQEADRDELAISFTKGCYLGQETVARLDALGQVQKKLVRWSVSGAPEARIKLEAGTKLSEGEKIVGRLTSVACGDSESFAIGYARRSHFDPGSTAASLIESTGTTIVGTVL